MNNTSETEQSWDLIITPRKKWWNLQLSQPTPAFVWRRGRDNGWGSLNVLVVSRKYLIDLSTTSIIELRNSTLYEPNSNHN